jgi:hypothetical protein
MREVSNVNFVNLFLKPIWVSPLGSGDSSDEGRSHLFSCIITDVLMCEISRFR